ncbi:MAG: hypothetical protein R6V19_10005 [Armatimonadota bacterium]
MSKIWAPLVMLALIVTAIPAVAQDDAQATAALDMIEQFGDATTKMMKEENTDFAFADALLLPEDREAQIRIQSAMFLLQTILAVAPTPENVTEMTDDTAVVTMTPEPVPFVLRNVNGQWRIDLEATVDNLPENARAVVEPTEEAMQQEKERATAGACYNNLRQLGRAALIYAQEHDGTLPDADSWMDQLEEYVNDDSVLQCPAAQDVKYGYAMNERLDGVNVEDINNLAHTVLFFASTLDTRNAAGNKETIPAPARHSMGNGFAFADGHAELREDVPNFDPDANAATQEGTPENQPAPPTPAQ